MNYGPRENFGFDSFEEGFKIFIKTCSSSWVEGNLSSSYEKTKELKYLKDDEFKLVKGFVENTCKNIEPSKYGINKISLALLIWIRPTLIGLEFIKISR